MPPVALGLVAKLTLRAGRVAVAEVEGPDVALQLVDSLHLDDYRYLHATRADLLRRLMRTDDARAAYLRALHLTDEPTERRFLQRRLRELEPPVLTRGQ